jgi:hypothetical protein
MTPLSLFDIRQAPSAFRRMARAQHIGKVVLTMPPGQEDDET